MRAAEYNEDFAVRRTAVEHLPGVTEDSLKKYELGNTRPPNDVIAFMADAYNAPELISWYCANECPLGTRCREQEQAPAERILIRLQNELPKLQTAMKDLGQIISVFHLYTPFLFLRCCIFCFFSSGFFCNSFKKSFIAVIVLKFSKKPR